MAEVIDVICGVFDGWLSGLCRINGAIPTKASRVSAFSCTQRIPRHFAKALDIPLGQFSGSLSSQRYIVFGGARRCYARSERGQQLGSKRQLRTSGSGAIDKSGRED